MVQRKNQPDITGILALKYYSCFIYLCVCVYEKEGGREEKREREVAGGGWGWGRDSMTMHQLDSP